MQVVPLNPIAAQTFSVQLAGQDCQITLQQKSVGLFMDLWVGGVQILASMLCLDRVGLVQQAYLGFAGQLAFVDTQGTSDPEYAQFGSRYVLTYTP